tara:strand:+ start:7934 stop:8293 length:360 start_codon:yes stop_codon:yes gene_type:complete
MTEWKRTGKPAHNKAVERSAEDEYEWIPDPSCQKCGGSGEVWYVGSVYSSDGEREPEWTNEPCDCIMQRWVMKPDPRCLQCNGTGAVQERLIHPDTKEEYIKFHDCVCLRFVKEMINDE